MNWRQRFFTILILIAFFLLFFGGILVRLYTDWLWFSHDVSYPQVFSTILSSKWTLFLLFGGVFTAFALLNLFIANRVIGSVEEPGFAVQGERIIKITRLVRRGAMALLVLGTVVLGCLYGLTAAGYWNEYLLFRNGTEFGQKDPVFGRDVGFYVFQLPFLAFISGNALFGLLVVLVGTTAFYYFNRGLGWLGNMPTFMPSVKPHLLILSALFIVSVAVNTWLAQYNVLFSDHDQFFGAGYTDLNAHLPIIRMSAAGFLISALLCLIYLRPGASILVPIGSFVVVIAFWIVASVVYPPALQRFVVVPNQLERESPYIRRHLEFTRKAYALDKFTIKQMNVSEEIRQQDLDGSEGTLANLRLWDYRPLRQVYNSVQALKPYYQFFDVDVDRYMFDGEMRQVLLSLRELNVDGLSPTAKRWQNMHLLYTHGYGLVMNRVNEATSEGQPVLVVRDLPPQTPPDIPLENPAIYFGENTDRHIIVRSKLQELDYPKLVGNDDQEENKYVTYQGSGGVPLSGYFSRLMLAMRLQDTNLLLSGDLTPESRLIFRRMIGERVRTLFPYLALDQDPYPVIAEGKVMWIYDAYTHSDNYPYSKPFNSISARAPRFNYIRNSVKITIDAYSGDVKAYVSDENDPLMKAYRRAFPELFKPMDQMPPALKAHIRYPQSLFTIQANLLELYHTTDARVFFNKEDAWVIARELLQGNRTQPMEPYYVITQPPGEKEPRFVLILPFTPQGRDNMVAWLAAHCDPDRYGEVVVHRFPKERLVYGPAQIEARINQNPEIAQQLNLWNQQGSEVIRGHLLVIPLGQTMLYFEPIYLKASYEAAIPELKKVVMASGNRVVMTDTVEQGLDALMGEARATGRKARPPSSTATPSPTLPAGAPENLPALIDRANRSYDAAQDALKRGDWTTFGARMKEVEDALRKMKSP